MKIMHSPKPDWLDKHNLSVSYLMFEIYVVWRAIPTETLLVGIAELY
ncbi:hypothetical protein [Scytonema sp. NUACC26]